MNKRLQSHFFWGPFAPLSVLSGVALIIIASGRLAYSIFCAGGVIWIFILTALVFYAAKPILPVKQKLIVLLFIASFICSIYLLLVSLLNPLLVLGSWFYIIMILPCCMGSNIFEGMDEVDVKVILQKVAQEAACLGGLIIGLSLIREPIGFGSLSLPGGVWGFFEIFSSTNEEVFFPVQILSVSAGGLIVFGFGIAVFRFFQAQQPVPGERKSYMAPPEDSGDEL